MHPRPAETAHHVKSFRLDHLVIRKHAKLLQNECQKVSYSQIVGTKSASIRLCLKTNGRTSGDIPQHADYQPKCEMLFPL
jgi:hypothetical protein